MNTEIEQERRARRLREHLGLDEDAVEVVLYMHRQLIELQREMQAMELELSQYRHRHARRMQGYRVYYEATWREIDSDEEDTGTRGRGDAEKRDY